VLGSSLGEKVDPDGKHQKLAKEEVLSLVGKDDFREIETALDEAFEAGILSVLDPGGDPEIEAKAGDESDEEMELRRALLAGIVGRGVRRRLQRRLVQRLFFLARRSIEVCRFVLDAYVVRCSQRRPGLVRCRWICVGQLVTM
jgi:hypothetical protein